MEECQKFYFYAEEVRVYIAYYINKWVSQGFYFCNQAEAEKKRGPKGYFGWVLFVVSQFHLSTGTHVAHFVHHYYIFYTPPNDTTVINLFRYPHSFLPPIPTRYPHSFKENIGALFMAEATISIPTRRLTVVVKCGPKGGAKVRRERRESTVWPCLFVFACMHLCMCDLLLSMLYVDINM